MPELERQMSCFHTYVEPMLHKYVCICGVGNILRKEGSRWGREKEEGNKK